MTVRIRGARADDQWRNRGLRREAATSDPCRDGFWEGMGFTPLVVEPVVTVADLRKRVASD